jgi:hypothetical protein
MAKMGCPGNVLPAFASYFTIAVIFLFHCIEKCDI